MIANYSIVSTMHRFDRSPLTSVKPDGGGVLIAIRTGVLGNRMTIPETEGVEMVAVNFNLDKIVHYVCCLYIPSGSKVSVYDAYKGAVGCRGRLF